MGLVDGRRRWSKEKIGAVWRLNLYLQRGPLPSKGQESDLDQAHLAYVASAEIHVSILSFPLYSFGAKTPVCRSNKPLSTPFLEDNKTTLNASHLYTHNTWIGTMSACVWAL